MGKRIAVVLFNLGGPDEPDAIGPFLFNLFNDKAIISVPQPLRWCLATLISHRRVPDAREIYAKIGGRSPLLPKTRAQAEALEAALADDGEVRVFVCMRYWHPMSAETAAEVQVFDPEEIVLLPLYPQFSTATTASSLDDWHKAAAREGIVAPTRALCCYPDVAGLVDAHAGLIRPALAEAAAHGTPRLLFSAHGLPRKIVTRGDPYVWQVERTADAVARQLEDDFPGLDWVVCYQSRVGPLEWVGPSTDDELRRAGRDGVPVVVVPIAFVSEHSETLVELDMDYRKLAGDHGVPAYIRVPALGVDGGFIAALATLTRRALANDGATDGESLCSGTGGRVCPTDFARCPLAHRTG